MASWRTPYPLLALRRAMQDLVWVSRV
uniref:Uncharacterized protein n=1 Tax=Anguilla anguilla TaxID=7936 RepID=A0A0E9TD71_ANGAN